MPFTTETTTTKSVYVWNDDPDYYATAELDTSGSDPARLTNLQVYNKGTDGPTYAVSLGNGQEDDVLLAFVTFLKGVITDLETEMTP